MSRSINQRGFSAFELILIVGVLGIIAVVGLRFMNDHSKTQQAATKSATTSSATASVAPVVNSTNDLDKASATLDANDPASTNSSDSSSLDTQLSAN